MMDEIGASFTDIHTQALYICMYIGKDESRYRIFHPYVNKYFFESERKPPHSTREGNRRPFAGFFGIIRTRRLPAVPLASHRFICPAIPMRALPRPAARRTRARVPYICHYFL